MKSSKARFLNWRELRFPSRCWMTEECSAISASFRAALVNLFLVSETCWSIFFCPEQWKAVLYLVSSCKTHLKSWFMRFVSSVFSATGTGSYKLVHSQSANVFQRKRPGGNVLALRYSDLYSYPAGQQWCEPRCGLLSNGESGQVSADNWGL